MHLCVQFYIKELFLSSQQEMSIRVPWIFENVTLKGLIIKWITTVKSDLKIIFLIVCIGKIKLYPVPLKLSTSKQIYIKSYEDFKKLILYI